MKTYSVKFKGEIKVLAEDEYDAISRAGDKLKENSWRYCEVKEI